MAETDVNQTEAEKTVVAESPAGEPTLLGTPVVCPVCGTENSPSEKYCGDCGFLLSSTPGEGAPSYDVSGMPKLADTAGQREFVLKEGENTVGREATDVLIDDPSVSRVHAVLGVEEGRCWVQDLGSTNGTFVDGRRLSKDERVELANGARLKFGSSVLVLELSQTPGTEAVGTPEGTEAAEECPAEAEVPEAEEVSAAPVARLRTPGEPAFEFPVSPGTNTIGRRSDNDIALTGDAYVSSSHAQIVAEDAEFWLVDVGSTNGTVVNGSRIEPETRVALTSGDEIVVGRTVLIFEVLQQRLSGDGAEQLP